MTITAGHEETTDRPLTGGQRAEPLFTGPPGASAERGGGTPGPPPVGPPGVGDVGGRPDLGGHEGAGRPPVVTEPATPGSRGRRPRFLRRHRWAAIVSAALVVVLVAGAGAFVYAWNHSGPRPVSTATAYQRFRSGASGGVVDPGRLRPHQGVYSYDGAGHEHISVPPKSQIEGPGMPGTVSYQSNGCWTWRVDYSDSHWQSATFCPRSGNLVEVARAGWYRWDFVALAVADTASFRCSAEVSLPAVVEVGQQFPFKCTGTNSPLKMAPVTMRGTNRYLGPATVRIDGADVPTLHFREVATFSGGQTGTNVSNLWISTVNGLPVKGNWSTRVTSPTFLGTSTLTGAAQFVLRSLTPRS